jgi:hypothetical protein
MAPCRRRWARRCRRRKCMGSALHLSVCRRRLLSAHRNVRAWARRLVIATTSTSRGRRACRVWTSRLCIARSSPSGVRATGNACVFFHAHAHPDCLFPWRNANFLQTIYDADVGPRRFTVDEVLCSLEDVPVAETCVIECGERHLGRKFVLDS